MDFSRSYISFFDTSIDLGDYNTDYYLFDQMVHFSKKTKIEKGMKEYGFKTSKAKKKINNDSV